jgi:Rhodopirellula transposase DDE domain
VAAAYRAWVTDRRALAAKVARLWPHLDERARRLFAASEARDIGHGGVSMVSRACGLSRVTITKGLQELEEPPLPAGRVRRAGAGRLMIELVDPELPSRLEALVEPLTRGDPQSPLRWTTKGTRALAAALTAQRHPISHETVAQLLRDMDYSLQGNRKTEEGSDHPDRDAQFQVISDQVRQALVAKRPVISVDTKKKELLGNYSNAGRQWRKTKAPEQVKVHDFPDPSVPRAYPYGIYDLGRNTGFVNVGTDHDTGAFAVASIRGWWRAEGRRLYPHARTLLITADGGGSNGYRLRQWKMKLQALADEARIAIRVCHFPPGTSKWNKVEHRLFSFISSNWRGEPLRDYETIVRLIAKTTTAKGLTVTCRLDRRRYPIGDKVSDAEIATVNLTPDAFHGEWNYVIRPHSAL